MPTSAIMTKLEEHLKNNDWFIGTNITDPESCIKFYDNH